MTGTYSEAAEMTVLGAVLLDPQCVSKIQEESVTPEDFYITAHGAIWQAMVSLSDRGGHIDPVLVYEEMRSHATHTEIDGVVYLTNMLAAATTSAYVASHAKIVKDLSCRRAITMHAADAVNMAQDSNATETAAVLLEKIESTMAAQRARKGRPEMRSLVRTVFAQIQSQLDSTEARGIPTGFVRFDNMLGNLRPSQFIVIGARPGVGKTSWLLNVTLHVAFAGYPVGFFSLEMAGDELVRRMLAMQSGLDHMRIMRAELSTNQEWEVLIEAAKKLTPLPIVVEDLPMSLGELRRRMRYMVKEQQCKVICIDYLQLVKNKQANAAREREVAEVSTTLKELAKEHRVPIIALAQLNRGMESRQSRKPMLSDLRESGSIEQDADLVAFIHRDPAAEVEADRAKAEFLVAKNRHGPTGTILMHFQPELTSFREDDGVPGF